MRALVPEHRHLEARYVDGRLDDLRRAAVTHEPRRHHRHEIAVRDDRHHEQNVRHGQHDAPREAGFRERMIGEALKAAAVRRHDYVIELAELRERRPPLQARMTCSADEHVPLGEARAAAQVARRAFGDVECGIDVALLRLLRDSRRHRLHCPGFDVLPPFVVYRTSRADAARFSTICDSLGQRLDDLSKIEPVPFRPQNAGADEIVQLTLRAGVVPQRSGFAAHVA